MPRAAREPRRHRVSPLAREFVPGAAVVLRRVSSSIPRAPAVAISPTNTPASTALTEPASAESTNTATAAAATTARTERRVEPPAQTPCKFFKAGYCSRGEKCWFEHEAPKEKTAKVDTHATVAAETSKDEEPCAICFEKPETYGLMTGCDHVFCLTCIRQWRSSSSNRSANADPYDDPNALANTSKTCPLCRIRTRYIIPSIVFPKSAYQKQQIERVYLLRLSNIPCRYFAASLVPRAPPPPGPNGSIPPHGRLSTGPWCPFGNDCHYRHEKEPGVKYTFTDSELSRMMWGQRASARRRVGIRRSFRRNAERAGVDFLGAGGMPDWAFHFVENHFLSFEDPNDTEPDDLGDYDDHEEVPYPILDEEILTRDELRTHILDQLLILPW
ncbi:hypothetical protein FN846DRAFT_928630 [Sphaerosporella brunnea]|uniref:Uncharacterized protein n=1 Tax=Sphaerosporella brunnea TaxID=1250544 RepID=A0A5J5F9C2_9PEZI|nr:hypothetical protein FN846DRAFT_928630 [Sphaerosporella brunnea]